MHLAKPKLYRPKEGSSIKIRAFNRFERALCHLWIFD